MTKMDKLRAWRFSGILSFVLCLLGVPSINFGRPIPPVIFYSDLESGPNIGGARNAGAFVTIYGAHFGSTQGSSYVTIGGGRAASYVVWTDSKIAFQVGAEAATGDVVVATAYGVSNAIPFTIRPGRIYFVAKDGKDSHSGSFSAPWATLLHARDTVRAGDIVYARDGVSQTTDDGSGWSSCLVIGGKGGSPGNPIAFVVYPGESATIGNVNGESHGGCAAGIRNKGQGENYWVIAGFTIRGGAAAIATGYNHDWRVVANDMTCPDGNDQTACFAFGPMKTMRAYGNNVHDVASNFDPGKVTALYHGVYIVDGTSDVDFGWNTVANVHGGRGIQENSSTKEDAYNLQIHDNVIHDTQCDGIVLVTIDPSKPGGIHVWNNVVYNAGKGPNNYEGSGAWRCIGLTGYTASGAATTGTIEIFNNTMYACGTFSKPPYTQSSGGVAISGPYPNKRLHVYNNIIYLTTGPNSGYPYLAADDGTGHDCSLSQSCDRIFGSNNLFFGNGPAPQDAHLKDSRCGDPQFVDPAKHDFHLKANSLGRMAGVQTDVKTDREGNPRGGGSGWDLGAYQSSPQ